MPDQALYVLTGSGCDFGGIVVISLQSRVLLVSGDIEERSTIDDRACALSFVLPHHFAGKLSVGFGKWCFKDQ